MPGTVLAVKVSPGQAVKRGEVLLILEAMKMENEITSPADGTVSQVRVQAGTTVNTGDAMVDIA
jgi:biotin carboxyl carrier protein